MMILQVNGHPHGAASEFPNIFSNQPSSLLEETLTTAFCRVIQGVLKVQQSYLQFLLIWRTVICWWEKLYDINDDRTHIELETHFFSFCEKPCASVELPQLTHQHSLLDCDGILGDWGGI